MMVTPTWQGGGSMSIGDPRTATTLVNVILIMMRLHNYTMGRQVPSIKSNFSPKFHMLLDLVL